MVNRAFTPEEQEQIRMEMGLNYFEIGQKRFPEAWKLTIFTFFVTAFKNPEAFIGGLENAMQEESITDAEKFAFLQQMHEWAKETKIKLVYTPKD